MSASLQERPNDRAIELGTEVNWPLVCAAVALGVLVLAPPLALILFSGPTAGPGEGQVLVQHNAIPVQKPTDLPAKPTGPRLPATSPHSGPTTVVVVVPPAPEIPELIAPPALVQAPSPPAAPRSPEIVASTPAPRSATAVATPRFTGPRSFVRDQSATEKDLCERLLKFREIDLDTQKGTTAKLLAQTKKITPSAGDRDATPAILTLLASRSDLKGLPVWTGSLCQVERKEAELMGQLSPCVRRSPWRGERKNSASATREPWRSRSTNSWSVGSPRNPGWGRCSSA